MSTDVPSPETPSSFDVPPSVHAPSPFDHPKADIILRSSDNVDFRVFKLFLSLASPFFEAMFELPQPSPESSGDEVKDGLAVISVTEDSSTLNTFLRFCYPSTLAEDPNLEELTDVVKVLDAARKYSLELIEKKVGHALGSPAVLEKEPFRAFAIACHSKLENETRIAAKSTLHYSLIPPVIKELDLITAMDLRQLLDYHIQCAAAVEGLTSLTWIDNHYGNTGCTWLTSGQDAYGYNRCNCSRSSKYRIQQSYTPPDWWAEYMDTTWASLRDKPCGATVLGGLDAAVSKARDRCSHCGQNVFERMTEFTKVFSEAVERVTAEIRLDIEGMTVTNIY